MINLLEREPLPNGSLIILVGTYPPPYGGVSVRIKRLSGLINAKGAKCVVFSPRQHSNHPDTVSYPEFLKLILANFWYRPKQGLLVHLQHTNLQTFRLKWYGFICLVRLCGGSVVVSNGGLWHDIGKLPFHKRFLFRRVTAKINRYIAVGSHIAENLVRGGCPRDKISIIPGFVPPDERELTDPKSIPKELENFLQKHNPIIVANASGVVFLKGRDLYGLDLCIELTARLLRYYPDIGFIYAIAPGGHGSTDDWDYLYKMRQTCRRLGIESHFYFRICSEPFTPLLKRSHIFVRPTSTDGDSNSIREALYLRKPVLASNVVSRPNGCLIFKDNDIDDIFEKANSILTDYRWHQQKMNQLDLSFPHHDLLSLYARILKAQLT